MEKNFTVFSTNEKGVITVGVTLNDGRVILFNYREPSNINNTEQLKSILFFNIESIEIQK